MLNDNGDKVNIKSDILLEICEKTKKRIEEEKLNISLELMREKALAMPNKTPFLFENALKNKDMNFICEIKKASPSKGVIVEDFDYKAIAKEYEKAGASAISCLSEPYYFQGSDKYIEEISKCVSIPILRKDFFVDEYMIYQAKVLGASAILLICSVLSEVELKTYFQIANTLGLSSIFETHTKEEVQKAINCKARIIGVNNRNLKTFELDTNRSCEFRKLVSKDIIFISESGIGTKEDIKKLWDNDINCVLIGETLMKKNDKKQAMSELKSLL